MGVKERTKLEKSVKLKTQVNSKDFQFNDCFQ